MTDTAYDERRRQEKAWRDEGRRVFDEGLLEADRRIERFETRHALLVGSLLVLGALLAEFPELWIGVVLRLVGIRP